jgi:hypothetical protein
MNLTTAVDPLRRRAFPRSVCLKARHGVPYQNRPAYEDPSGHDLKDVHKHGVTGDRLIPGRGLATAFSRGASRKMIGSFCL